MQGYLRTHRKDYGRNDRQSLINNTPMNLFERWQWLKAADLPETEKRPLLIAVQKKIIARLPAKAWTTDPTVLVKGQA